MKQELHPISWFAGFLTLLLPGLGHIYQGRTSKGLFFMVALLGLFHVGQAMAGWQAVFLPPPVETPNGQIRWENLPATERAKLVPQACYNRLHFLGQLWIGLPALPAWLHYFDAKIPFAAQFPVLLEYEKTPGQFEFNNLERSSDKTPSLGLIYTVIAGALNLLVIFDAIAGPLPLPPKDEPKPDETPKEAVT